MVRFGVSFTDTSSPRHSSNNGNIYGGSCGHREIWVRFFKVPICTRGWFIKNATDILWNSSKIIEPTVKAWARGQNNWSRALRWVIVHLYSSSTFRGTTNFMKKVVFQFLHFCKKWQKYYTKSQKLKNINKYTLLVLIITSKVFEASLSFDSRSNHFWDMPQSNSCIFYASPSRWYWVRWPALLGL